MNKYNFIDSWSEFLFQMEPVALRPLSNMRLVKYENHLYMFIYIAAINPICFCYSCSMALVF